MALWEYKVISSGKGGFATPALLESFLNQLGNEDWEIIEFRTLPDNPLAFSGLARRPTQRDWTLEAAAAAAAKVESDKLRAEFAAKFQGANASGASGDAAAKEGDIGIPNRDETYRRPRDTEHDQDPYALDDSASEEHEDIPDEDVLPTFFEAVRPHMRRNQKGPGYSVGVDYLLKKFEMIEDDLFNALKEIGFAIPEDEDDRPVYVEYDGDIYWLNTNRRGELWLNTREKPRPVFKVVKANRLSPEEEAQAEQPAEAPVENQGRNQQQRRQDQRQEQRQRRQEQQQQAAAAAEQAQQAAQAAAEGVAEENLVQAAESEEVVAQSAEGEEPGEQTQGQPQQRQPREGSQQHERGEKQPVHLPEGLGLLERLRPLMRRSRGGWSGTISYLSRALRNNEAGLVEALSKVGLVPPAVAGEKAPVVESGPFSYWLNRDGRGGIWINVRESKRMRHEEKQGRSETTESGSSPESSESAVPAVESTASVQEAQVTEGQATTAAAPSTEDESAAVTEAPVTVEQAKTEDSVVPVQDVPVAAEVPQATAVETTEPRESVTTVQAPAVELQPVQTELSGVLGEQSTLPLAGVRLLLKEGRPGVYSAELCILAEQLEKNVEEFLSVLVSTGLKAPERPREKAVTVEHANEAFWLSRNTKGELWLNAKAAKLAKKEDDEEDDSEPVSTEEEAAAEKPKRAPRSRRKTGTEETQA